MSTGRPAVPNDDSVGTSFFLLCGEHFLSASSRQDRQRERGAAASPSPEVYVGEGDNQEAERTGTALLKPQGKNLLSTGLKAPHKLWLLSLDKRST